MHQIKPSSRQTRVAPRSKPSEIVTATGLHSGERLDIETHDGEIIIRRAVARFTLGELFRGKTPEEWRGAYASAFDWGPDVGREVVEE